MSKYTIKEHREKAYKENYSCNYTYDLGHSDKFIEPHQLKYGMDWDGLGDSLSFGLDNLKGFINKDAKIDLNSFGNPEYGVIGFPCLITLFEYVIEDFQELMHYIYSLQIQINDLQDQINDIQKETVDE